MIALSYRFHLRMLAFAGVLTLTLGLALASPATADREKNRYQQTNLVSDLPGLAAVHDSNLVNPWGMALSDTGPFWVSDNGTGVATLYDGTGQPFPVGSPLVVTIPPSTGSAPTGQVFNPQAVNPMSSDFMVTDSVSGKSGRSFFIFATEDGTISGWSPSVPPPV